ncbi:MAG TPA: hypothetical protein VF533_12705 [Solirubrobacteraceae bacterium]
MAAQADRDAGGRGAIAVPALAFAVMAATVAAGQVLAAGGTRLYVPEPPFVWRGDVRAHALLAVALVVLAGAVWAGPRLVAVRPATFAGAALGLTVLVRLAVAAARGGPEAWDRVFDPARSFEAANEYLPALPALRYGVHIFLDRFAEVVPALPVHAAGHPPGLLVVMHALGIDTPAGLAALCIAAGALGTPVLYLLARRLLDEPAARMAALLLALSPGAAMFGVTSADGLYMTLGILAALALVQAPRWAGPLVLAAVSFFAWSLLAVGAWATVVWLRRDGLRAAVLAAGLAGIGLVAFYALLHAATGFDPLGTLTSTEQVYRAGIARGRPYWFWVLGSPTAFLVTVGLPISWLALRALAAGRTVALAIFAVIAISALLGFTKAETERIWLFFAPLLCLAAAAALPRRHLRLVLALLAVQALASELLFDSVW